MSQSPVAEALPRRPQAISPRRRERIFYLCMTGALVLTVFAGFAPTYFLQGYFGTPPLPPLVHLHGVVFTGWMLLFLVQTGLVAAHRTGLHRRLGVAGGVLAVLMVVVGVVTAVSRAAQGHSPPGTQPLQFLVIPLGEMVTFPALVGAALYYRRRVDAHKRLMLLATIAISSAAVARLPFGILRYGPPAFFGLTDLLVVPMVVHDLATRGRVHPATLWGSLFLVASQVGRVLLGGTQAWLDFAAWATAWAA